LFILCQSTLNSKFQAAEDERRLLFSQLAEKKEEVALLLRDLAQWKESKAELEEKLHQQETELLDSKELRVQLEIEKKLRMKCEMHEENERRERTAAVAQLMAVQSESNKRIQEMEEISQAQQDNFQREINELNQNNETLTEDCKQKANRIAGLEKEVENLHLALENASTNHKSFEELSRASGEVEVLRRRLKEATESQVRKFIS
jgi:chromosome segregation ATPase